MDVGARVWVHDPTQDLVWVSARIARISESYDAASAWTEQLAPSPSKCHDITLVFKTPGECENVLLQNQREEQDQADLVALPHLHEASILHALRVRYERDAIYTRIGEILISINPFKKLPQLYGRAVMETHTRDDGSSLLREPHLFGIARAAYVDMARNARSQSILISGESGAGKTEATKIMMKFYALTCSASAHAAPAAVDSASAPVSIESQVLQSNPILEAFGNARTTRNDNSSRFGKFIELEFARSSGDATDAAHVIAGARIRTYLLEKIRVIKQSTHERNFHIFYELLAAAATGMCACVSPAAVASWQLLDATQFRLVNQSACYTRRDNVDDAAQFDKTVRAMHGIGMGDDEVTNVLEIVAAMLHMGNIGFCESQSLETDNVLEAHVVAGADATTGVAHFAVAAELLRVSPAQLEAALTTRQLHTATESLVVRMDAAQASNTCNALVMECYRLLFAWLVERVNTKIRSSSARSGAPAGACIGLLDIFGFEDMAVNSFEQLCINYANEALQHQFNAFVFTEEQALYATEGIDWTFVDFPNNTACLALFEQRPIGLFSLTDQECVFPQGSDRALMTKFYTEFATKRQHAHFVAAPGGLRQTHFIVAHYAGNVAYTVDGFVAKNKDSFCESAAQLLAMSSSPLIQRLAGAACASADDSASASPAPVAPTPARVAMRRAKSSIAAVSVGTQFKQQLGELLDTIRATTPHYVRCIKPNDANVRDAFQCSRVVEQLRSGGVLEAVRVARAGFPVRMTHEQFLDRYERVLLLQRLQRPSARAGVAMQSIATRLRASLETLAVVLQGAEAARAALSVPSGVSLGKTRVFFRRQPYEQLERARALARAKCVVKLQTHWRMHQLCQRYQAIRQLALKLQAYTRGQRARALVRFMRETTSATRLQTCVRAFVARRKFQRARCAVLQCQSHVRRRRAARVVQTLREARAATRIATAWRRFFRARAYARMRSAVVALQCAARVRVAKTQLAALRLESKNVAKLQEDNLQLKGELAQLKQQLEAMRSIIVTSGAAAPKRLDAAQVLEPHDDSADAFASDHESNQATTLALDSGNPNCADSFVAATRPRRVSFPLCVDLVASAHKPTLSSPNAHCATVSTTVSTTFATVMTTSTTTRRTGQRRTSLPDMPYSTASGPDFARLSPRTIGRRHSLDLWRAQQQLAAQEVQQLRDELKASTLSTAHVEHDAQERAVRKLVASQIKAKTMRLQLSPSSSSAMALALPAFEDNNSSGDEVHGAESPWYDDDDDDDDDDPCSTGRSGRRRSLTVEDASFTMGGRQLYAAPMTTSGAYDRFSWDVKPASRGLAAYFDSRDKHSDDVLRAPMRAASFSSGVRPRSSSGASTWRSTISVTPSVVALPRWSKDTVCKECHCKFTLLTRRHHCRHCGHSFCFEHSTRKLLLPWLGYTERQRVCDGCFELHLLNEEHGTPVLLTRSPRRHHVSADSAASAFAPIAPLPTPVD